MAIEGRTNLLFSFEKMALRDGIRGARDAKTFAEALLVLDQEIDQRASFEAFADAIASLPHARSRVLTWPVVTVFPFLAQPRRHIFLKPNVTRRAAQAYGFDFVCDARGHVLVVSAAWAHDHAHDGHGSDVVGARRGMEGERQDGRGVRGEHVVRTVDAAMVVEPVAAARREETDVGRDGPRGSRARRSA